MRDPERAARAVALGGGPDEGAEVVEASLRRWVVGPLGRPWRRAVDSREDLDALPGGLADDRVVVAPVQRGGCARLNGAPDEVDAQGPDMAVTHAVDFGRRRILCRHHAVEGTRSARGARTRSAGADEQQGGEGAEQMTRAHSGSLGRSAREADERVPGRLRVEVHGEEAGVGE